MLKASFFENCNSCKGNICFFFDSIHLNLTPQRPHCFFTRKSQYSLSHNFYVLLKFSLIFLDVFYQILYILIFLIFFILFQIYNLHDCLCVQLLKQHCKYKIRYLNSPKNMKILQEPQVIDISIENNFENHHFLILGISTFQGLLMH